MLAFSAPRSCTPPTPRSCTPPPQHTVVRNASAPSFRSTTPAPTVQVQERRLTPSSSRRLSDGAVKPWGGFPATAAAPLMMQGLGQALVPESSDRLRDRMRERLMQSGVSNGWPGSIAQPQPSQNAVHRSHTPPRTMQGKAPCRLLCYGDSNTAGYNPGSPVHTPYADRLAEGLTRAGVDVAVMCCGLSGKTTKEMLQAASAPAVPDAFGRIGKGLARMLQDEGPQDLVILMSGTNDIGMNNGTSAQEIARDVQTLQGVCRQHNSPAIILGPPSLPDGPFAVARRQLVSILSNWAHSAPGVKGFFDAEELVPRQPQFWAPDGFHFTPLGAAELGHRLVPLVLPLLQGLGWGTSLPQALPATPRQRFTEGDAVEVWAKSSQTWCSGHVLAANGHVVTALFGLPDGATAQKIVHASSTELRPPQGSSSRRLSESSSMTLVSPRFAAQGRGASSTVPAAGGSGRFQYGLGGVAGAVQASGSGRFPNDVSSAGFPAATELAHQGYSAVQASGSGRFPHDVGSAGFPVATEIAHQGYSAQVPVTRPLSGSGRFPYDVGSAGFPGATELPHQGYSAQVPVTASMTAAEVLEVKLAERSAKQDAQAYTAGDTVEVWSKTCQAWCAGTVVDIEGPMINCRIRLPSGQLASKAMPKGHAGLRHLVAPGLTLKC